MIFQDRTFDTGEITLHYQEGPDNGPALVLIHGATGSCNDWEPILDVLARDWHLFLLDQRGHGLSGHAAGIAQYHAAYNIRDTCALLRDVVKEPAVVWGHSWGAVIALLSAGLVHDFLRGIVLEDPPVMVRREICPEMKPYMEYFGMVLQLKQSASTLEELRAALRQAMPQEAEEVLEGRSVNLCHVDPNFLRIVLAGPEIVAGIDFAEAIRAATMPVLLLQADPEKGAALVQEDLDFVLANNPNFNLVHFPGSGHGIHNEQPQKVLEAFEEFTRRLNAG